jgi:site-specific recombinase XerD
MPSLTEILAAHLALLRLRGRAERTCTERRYAVLRLAAWLERYAESTLVRSGTALAGHGARGEPATGPCELHETPGQGLVLATAADLQAWRASLTTGDAATGAYCAHIAGFYSFCVDQGIREDNPAADLPVPQKLPGVPRPVSEEELAAALACASPRVRPWLVLAGWAGLRAKEIALLRRECVLDTAEPPVLLIARNATKGKRERVVDMSPDVLAELRLAGLPRSGYVFGRHDGASGPNAPWLISHLAGQCLREAGSAATLHQLRHRFATQLYRQTGDIRLVQAMLGHASVATTAVYADWDRARAAEAVAALPFPGRLRAVG